MSAPRVSIVIPSYNQAPFLAATLDSILAQSHRPYPVGAVIDERARSREDAQPALTTDLT